MSNLAYYCSCLKKHFWVFEIPPKPKIQAETLRLPANVTKRWQNAKPLTFFSCLKQVFRLHMTMIGVDYVSASNYSQKRMTIQIEEKPTAWLLLRTVAHKAI